MNRVFITVIHMRQLRQIFNILAEFDMLCPELRDAVTAHKNHLRLLNLVLWLKKNALLSPENFNLALEHAEPRSLDLMLLELDEIEILPQERFVLAAKHPKPIELMEAIRQLQDSKRWTKEIFSCVVTHHDPEIARAIIVLPKDALTPKNLELLRSHPNSKNLACAFVQLIQMARFTDACRDMVYHHQHPHAVTLVFSYLHKAGIATQENLACLTADNHTSLVIDETLRYLWPRIPTHRLTQVNFERLLVAAEQPNPKERLTEARDQILANIPQAGAGHVAYLNPAQSTHTVSVHRTVSVSAATLMRAYGDGLDLDDTIDAIKTFLNGLDDSPKHQAAKRCIEHITETGYTFSDTSGVSIRQLLALAYTAIHDDKKRLGLLQDAMDCFVEGLYEIQRGYNIDRGQGPEEGVDFPICSAGAFNKIIEKLKGIHQDVEIFYITREGAALKFSRIANASAKAHLQILAAPKTAEEYLNNKNLLERLKADNTLEFIWENIKEEIEKQKSVENLDDA